MDLTADDTIALFLHALTRLRVDDDGLVGTDAADVLACSNLCKLVREATAATALDDVRSLLLRRLVGCTELVITTGVVRGPGNREIVRDWLNARAEFLGNEFGAVES